MSDAGTFSSRFQERLATYANPSAAKAWLDRNWQRVRDLFENVRVRDFVFEPIKDVFASVGTTPADRIQSVITQVAVANAILAGLPGQMGVGVAVSMGLEGWMAYVIAREVGLKVSRPSDVWTYFGLLAGVGLVIVAGVKHLLSFAFSLFAIIPGINPLIPAELFVTDLVGVLFWVGFEAARDKGTFLVPSKALAQVWSRTKELYGYQFSILKRGLSPDNLSRIGRKLSSWFKGEIPDVAHARGEIAATACMGWLLAGHYDGFGGPLGGAFIQAIRDRFPQLASAPVSEIADHMRTYDAAQMEGVVNEVKGRMFELLIIEAENSDGDSITAVSEGDMSQPATDLILKDNETGEAVAIQLKATDSPSYIEHALQRYPDVPILTTEEVSEHFAGSDLVSGSNIANERLTTVTQDNFDRLVEGLQPLSASATAAAGAATQATIGLWPFVAARLRGQISEEQMSLAFKKVLGEAGVSLASRVSYAIVFGPVFAWYLLARGVLKGVRATQ